MDGKPTLTGRPANDSEPDKIIGTRTTVLPGGEPLPAADFRSLFEAAPGLFLALYPDPPNFTIVAASDGYLQATKTRRSEITGRGIFDVFPDNPNDPHASGVANLRTSLETVLRNRAANIMAVQKYDVRKPEADGGGWDERYWSPVNSPVFGPEGNLAYIIHRVEDVTEFVRSKRQRGLPQTQSPERALVLLADHNPETRDHARRLLGERYAVETAADGESALASIRLRRPDLILADVALPRLNGIELLRQLRADPATQSLPMMLLSSRTGDESRIEGLQAGADDYLTRPFSARQLLGRVNGRLELARLRRESDERYLRLLELMPAAVYTCDAPSGILTYYNRQAAELWGRAPAIGDTDERFCGAERLLRADGTPLPHAESPLAQVLRGAAPVRNQEVIVQRPDGSRLSVNVNIDPLTNAGGEMTGAINVFQNVTEEKRLFEALRESEERFRAIFEQSATGVAVCDPESGHYLKVNQAYCDLTGYTAEELLQKTWQDITQPEEDTERNIEMARTAREQADPFYTLEKRYVRKDGSTIWAKLFATYIRNSSGQVTYNIGVIVDITDRKCAEEAARESEERFRHMADNAPVMVWVTEPDGAFSFISKSWYEFTGQSTEASPGEGWKQSLHPEDRAAVEVQFSDANRKREPFRIEFRVRNQAREFSWTLAAAAPRFASDGRFLGFIGSVIDITERKEAEQALRENQEKFRQQAKELEQQLIASGRLVSLGEVTASMAHEFNNPLGIIMGFVEDMLSGADPADPDYRALQIIDEESRRCKKIVQDLMEYARPKNAEFSPTDISEVIGKTLGLMANSLYKQKITAASNVDADLPRILADAQQLSQVLVNLYLNAIDAMPRGGELSVTAGVDGADASKPVVVIRVADTGFGIGPAELAKIFQPFYTAKKRRGLGLGLPICERIIKNHGGTIEVESEPDNGTTFRILLPVKNDSGNIEQDRWVSA